ncbi:MAG: RNA polymerase sigma factor [Immundisolibacter sp.]|uniref:RNA polymerase sigma factor n=1 Tax=Immundisolibacter sp. TaxID=1934948 RepID=UPI003D13D212
MKADAAALDAFLASIERRALRVAETAVGSRADALDIVQDAMLSLARSYGGRDPAQWPALFHRILEHRIQDCRRSRKRDGRYFVELAATDDEAPDPLANLAADPAPGPQRGTESSQALVALEAALRALPDRQREAFTLRIWQEADTAQAARAMGVSEGSVKTHLFRALVALRAVLGEHWP